MELENGSGDNISNCTLLFDSANYKVLAGLRAAMGLISFIGCTVVIFIILLFKKYRFFPQRLVLNIAVAALIHSISYTTSRVNYYTVREIDDPYCYFAGIFNHYTAAVELISIWFATINIFAVGMCRRNISKFEPVYYFTTYLLPCLWFWVPIWLKAYGTSGGWCGIKVVDEDCQPFRPSAYIQFGIWFVPLYVSTTVIIGLLVAVAMRLLRSIHRWKGKFDPMAQAGQRVLQNELRPLIWYPVIYLLLNSFSFISQIYRAIYPDSPSPILPYFRVLTSPLRGAFIALAFALDKDTRNRLNVTHCRAAILEWLHKAPRIELMESTTLYSSSENDVGNHYVKFDGNQ